MRRFLGPTGSVSRIVVESLALKSNMLGDPSARAVDVYVPAGCDGKGFPLLVDLVGFTSSGLSHTNWTAFRENLPERLDRLPIADLSNLGGTTMAKGVLIAAMDFSNVPADEFNDWYDTEHVPDYTAVADQQPCFGMQCDCL